MSSFPKNLKSMIIVLFLSLPFLLCSQRSSEALSEPQRRTFTCTKDRDGDAKVLSELCFFNDLTSADVLWANDRTAESLTEGTVLVIPKSKGDILAVWQSVQRRKKDVSAPLVSVKLHGVPLHARRGEGMPPRSERKDASSIVKPEASPPPKRESAVEITAPAVRGGTPQERLNAERKAPIPPFEPKGKTEGPMRIVISGDHVSLVRRPQALADLPRPSASVGLRRETILDGVRTSPRHPKGIGPLPQKMLWPVDGAVSSGFGKRGRRAHHSGIDIPMPKGTPIRAAKDGVIKQVVSAKSRGFRGYGNVVVIDHGNGLSTLYAHCLKYQVKKGQRVRQGETIGTVGRTGRATTNHVHFEVRVHGKPVNPIPYLLPRH